MIASPYTLGLDPAGDLESQHRLAQNNLLVNDRLVLESAHQASLFRSQQAFVRGCLDLPLSVGATR